MEIVPILNLSKEDSLLFATIMEHRDYFKVLVDKRTFDIKNGECTIYSNGEGRIRRIDKKVVDNL